MYKDFSIIIPGFNEEKRLDRNYRLLLKQLHSISKYNYEIIFVLDGCTDNTETKLKKMIGDNKNNSVFKIISYKENMGKGHAIHIGAKHIESNFLFFIDMDIPFNFTFISKAMHEFESGADAVIASRNLSESVNLTNEKILRKVLSRFSLFLENKVLGTSYTDLTCGFKGFKFSSTKEIFESLKTKRWMFDVEILYKMKKKGMYARELPIVLKNDPESRVYLLKDVVKSLIELYKIRAYDNKK